MSTKKVFHLPGFYFDEDKNRYFKLQPGSPHLHPVTGDRLQNRRKVKANKTIKKQRTDIHKQLRKPLEREKKLKTFSLLKQREQGGVCLKSFEQNVVRNMCKTFGHTLAIRLKSYCTDTTSTILCFPSFLLSSPCASELFCVLGEENSNANVVTRIENIDKSTQITQQHRISNHVLCRINDISLQPGNAVAWTGFYKTNDSRVAFVPNAQRLNPLTHFKFVKGDPWSCAFHAKQSLLTYSVDSQIVLVSDVEKHFSRTMQLKVGSQVVGMPNKVKSLCFVAHSPVLYCGLVNGRIVGMDCRSDMRGNNQANVILKEGYCIGSTFGIKAINNGQHLVSRHRYKYDRLRLWDIRNCTTPVLEYKSAEGYCENTYDMPHYLGSKLHVDVNERILSYTGNGSTLHLHDIYSGEELCVVPNVKVGTYSDCWPLLKGEPGIMGVDNEDCIFYTSYHYAS